MRIVKEYLTEDLGGVSGGNFSTLTSTPGMGTAQPATTGATTGAQMSGHGSTGSGDNWGNAVGPYKQTDNVKKVKKRKKKVVKEGSGMINPYDFVGTAMAKKVGAALPFKKGPNGTIKRKKTFENHIQTFEEFSGAINEPDEETFPDNNVQFKDNNSEKEGEDLSDEY